MALEGSLDQILTSALPHEVTHTILADHFRQPVPRWADEGAAILAEDAEEQKRHDQLARKILDTPGRAIPLERLLQLTNYPPDVVVLYAEGYSLTRFLVERKDHQTFLAFIKQGLAHNWDEAVKDQYGLANVRELETVWLAHLARNRVAPDTSPFRRTPCGFAHPGDSASGKRHLDAHPSRRLPLSPGDHLRHG